MKFKYFLRGLGTGIIFATLVCLVAYHTNDKNQFSDEMVIERAKELGMIEQDDPIAKLLEAETEKEEDSEQRDSETDATDSSEPEGEKSDATAENSSEASIDISETTEQITEEQSIPTTEQTTTESTTEQKAETVTITITGGSTSYPVCQKLQELGLIADAQEFDNYLVEHGYASRIRVGTHTLTIGMTFEEIAIQISDPM